MTVAKPRSSAFSIVAAAAAIELAIGRHPICTCGTIELWVGAETARRTSQMLVDWYSLSHIVHGLLFYAALRLLFAAPAHRVAVPRRLVRSRASWEVFENTPMVIDRYRETTAALGYSGDSVVNSVSDMLMMCAGFLVARSFPFWGSVLAILALELIPLFVIRDNLALNVWNLLAPNAHVAAWQAGH